MHETQTPDAIAERLEQLARDNEDRRTSASTELLELSERIVAFDALTGDAKAMHTLESLEADEERHARDAQRLALAVEYGRERVRGLRGVLHETARTQEGLGLVKAGASALTL